LIGAHCSCQKYRIALCTTRLALVQSLYLTFRSPDGPAVVFASFRFGARRPVVCTSWCRDGARPRNLFVGKDVAFQRGSSTVHQQVPRHLGSLKVLEGVDKLKACEPSIRMSEKYVVQTLRASDTTQPLPSSFRGLGYALGRVLSHTVNPGNREQNSSSLVIECSTANSMSHKELGRIPSRICFDSVL
jgi:hypothetical protein